jgi:hypothetical protein
MNSYSADEKAAVIGAHTSMFVSEQRGVSAHVLQSDCWWFCAWYFVVNSYHGRQGLCLYCYSFSQSHVMASMLHAAMALNTNDALDLEYAIAEANSQLDLLIEKEAIMYASPESGFSNSLNNGELEV